MLSTSQRILGHNPSRAQWALKSPFMWLEPQNNSDIRPLLRDQRHFWRFNSGSNMQNEEKKTSQQSRSDNPEIKHNKGLIYRKAFYD